jgi:uncharacterized protein (DUF736 family)
VRIARPSSRNAEVEPVLGAVGSESAQNRRRQQPARLDRQRDFMSGRCSAISVQSIDPENSASMCVYASPAPGLNRCRSCQFLMLGISLIPSRCQAEDRRRLAMRIRTLSLNVKARLIPTEPSRNGKAPDLRVLAGNVEVGAAWKRTSKENTVYHAVMLARGVERVPSAVTDQFRGATRNAFFSVSARRAHWRSRSRRPSENGSASARPVRTLSSTNCCSRPSTRGKRSADYECRIFDSRRLSFHSSVRGAGIARRRFAGSRAIDRGNSGLREEYSAPDSI